MQFTTHTTNQFKLAKNLWTVAPTNNLKSRLNRTFLNREDARAHKLLKKSEGYDETRIYMQEVTISVPTVDTNS